MIFQKDMIFTLSNDLDESCKEQSSLALQQSHVAWTKTMKILKKRMRLISLCRPGTVQNVNSNPSNEVHMLSSIISIQVTIVNNLCLSVKYELLVPWQIH